MSDQPKDSKKIPLRGTAWRIPYFGRSAILLRRLGQIILFAGQDRAGRRSRAEITQAGLVSWVVTGEVPQGERNTNYVCDTLIQVLRRAGEDWVLLENPREPADCEASNSSGARLQIQVVCAVVRQTFWKRLASIRRTGRRQSTVPELAAELRKPIEKKSSGLPPAIKTSLVLALDATRVSAYALDPVVEEFRRSYGAWCAEAGFQSVWVVGPFPEMVARLDVRAL